VESTGTFFAHAAVLARREERGVGIVQAARDLHVFGPSRCVDPLARQRFHRIARAGDGRESFRPAALSPRDRRTLLEGMPQIGVAAEARDFGGHDTRQHPGQYCGTAGCSRCENAGAERFEPVKLNAEIEPRGQRGEPVTANASRCLSYAARSTATAGPFVVDGRALQAAVAHQRGGGAMAHGHDGVHRTRVANSDRRLSATARCRRHRARHNR